MDQLAVGSWALGDGGKTVVLPIFWTKRAVLALFRPELAIFIQGSNRFDERSNRFDERSIRFDERSIRFDGRSIRFDGRSIRFDKRSIRFDERSIRFDERSIRFDEGSNCFDEGSNCFDGRSNGFGKRGVKGSVLTLFQSMKPCRRALGWGSRFWPCVGIDFRPRPKSRFIWPWQGAHRVTHPTVPTAVGIPRTLSPRPAR